MSLPLIHGGLATACLIYSLILAGYSFWRYFRGQGIDSAMWGVLGVGEVLYLAQGALGAVMLAQGLQAARTWIHILYGIVMVITVPGAYAITRGRDTRREAAIYGVLGLFLAGIALRAMTTGANP
ncbi:MAG: hypothetical protein ABI847_02170 [Anaerolineales bacterium]